ncbi:MAG: FAD-dependent monooxygenase, partial [Myxococcaceae bacterium]
MASPEIVIVGAGPAGMVLAYQLVTNGIPVRVLERHGDFDREFRGELINPVVLGPLEKLGVLQLATQRGDARPNVLRRLFVGKTREVMVPGGKELGSLISQPGFLQLLHELCSKHPHYRMDFNTTVLETMSESGAVVAVKTRKDGVEGRVDGRTFIICNGRNSALRKSAGLSSEAFTEGADVLWLRRDFSDAQDALPA